MTSLRESIKKMLVNADREPIQDDKGLFGTVDRFADGYIKEFQEYMNAVPPMDLGKAVGYQHAVTRMLRFLKGEEKQ